MFFFQSKSVIGIDIGTSTIKLAELDVSSKKAKLKNFVMAMTPPNVISGGEILDSITLGGAIGSAYQNLGSKRKKTCTGIWGTAVIVKRVSLPPIDKSLIADQVRWEAEQYIPLPIDEINLQYHVIPGAGDGLDVLLIAAKKDFIHKYMDTIGNAGLEPSILDVNGFALANCFEFNYGRFPGELIALLDMGSSTVNFVVVENGNPIFSRDLPVGGMTYTSELHKDLGISIEEAESLKVSASTGGEIPDEARGVIAAVNETISEEIKSGFDFFSATAPTSKFSRMFFSGGSIGVPGLLDNVSKTCGIPYEVFDPFENIDVKKSGLPSQQVNEIRRFAPICLGLALRKVGGK